jgi:hypothetical protein
MRSSQSLKKAKRKFYDIQIKLTTLSKINQAKTLFNARLQFGVLVLKMNPKGLGFESSLGQLIIFQLKYAKIVKSMLKSAKSTVSDIERSRMTIFIEIMSRNRRIYACIL